jgi:hypothetical protein
MPSEETGLAMQAQTALSAIKQLTNEWKTKVNRIDERFYNARRPHHQVIQSLQERYEERAIELAADVAPFSRSGRRLPPDDIEVVDEGITLCWHSDYDYRSHTVTWAELEQEDSDDQI